jgi:hypothetical protein
MLLAMKKEREETRKKEAEEEAKKKKAEEEANKKKAEEESKKKQAEEEAKKEKEAKKREKRRQLEELEKELGLLSDRPLSPRTQSRSSERSSPSKVKFTILLSSFPNRRVRSRMLQI